METDSSVRTKSMGKSPLAVREKKEKKKDTHDLL